MPTRAFQESVQGTFSWKDGLPDAEHAYVICLNAGLEITINPAECCNYQHGKEKFQLVCLLYLPCDPN